MAQRDDDEENGYESNVRYNPDHCLLDHDAVFGMIGNDFDEERTNSMENYENNPRDDIPGPISFLLRGSNSVGNNHLTHHTMTATTQQHQPINAKKQQKPTLHEMENWNEMKSIVEQRGQTKFLTSLEKIQNNRSTTSKDKIPLLPVLVRQILHYDSNESAHVLFGELESDTEIEGTISKKAIEKNTSILTVGTVVLLKKIQIYCPKPLKFHLIISEKNTAKVWVSENEENSMIVDHKSVLTRQERMNDEFTFDRNIDSLDEFTPTRMLNQQEEEENEEEEPILSSQPVVMRQQQPPSKFTPPQPQQQQPQQQQPPAGSVQTRTAFIRPKAPPVFTTPQQQDNHHPFSSKFKPVETPQISNLNDDSNLDLLQPFTTPRNSYMSSPEVTSNKRKVDSISSQTSLNDSSGGNNKRRKSPLDEESALLKDSFNDPLFDDSSNHSLSIPSSPPILLQDGESFLESRQGVTVPPLTVALSNSNSQKPCNSLTNISSSTNNKTTTGTTTKNVVGSVIPSKKAILFDDDDDDPLMGILDGDDDLFSSNSNSTIKSASNNAPTTKTSSTTTSINKPITTSSSNTTTTNTSTTMFRPPQFQTSNTTNKQQTTVVQQNNNQNNLNPHPPPRPNKQLVEDDDDDPLAGILEDSLFSSDSPLTVKNTPTGTTTKKQPGAIPPQPKKKTIQYDDDF